MDRELDRASASHLWQTLPIVRVHGALRSRNNLRVDIHCVERRECRIWPCTDFGSAASWTSHVACESRKQRQFTNGKLTLRAAGWMCVFKMFWPFSGLPVCTLWRTRSSGRADLNSLCVRIAPCPNLHGDSSCKGCALSVLVILRWSLHWPAVFGTDQSPRLYRSSIVMLSAWMQRHFRPIRSLTRSTVDTLTESIVA